MLIALDIALFGTLALLVWQDWKFRAVHWGALLALFVLLSVRTGAEAGWETLLSGTLLNLSFLVLQALGLTLWFSLRQGQFVNILRGHLGLGDVLFFVALVFVFHPANYLLFFVFGVIFALLVHGVYLLIFREGNRLIPLAGTLSAGLIICMCLQYGGLLPDFHDATWLQNLLAI